MRKDKKHFGIGIIIFTTLLGLMITGSEFDLLGTSPIIRIGYGFLFMGLTACSSVYLYISQNIENYESGLKAHHQQVKDINNLLDENIKLKKSLKGEK